MRKLALGVFLLIAGIATTLQAQIPTSTVSGIVRDSQGAIIQGAKVRITNTSQETTREGLTNVNGSYSVPDLLPGEYRAEVSSAGFATAQYAGIQLEAGRTFTLDAALTPASQVTTVNVTAAAQTVDLAQSMLQGQITETTIESIPLNGRN